MDLGEFEAIVEKILETVPEEFKEKVENLSIIIDESNILSANHESKKRKNEIMLALYHGIPMTRRSGSKPIFPDRITIYKKAIESVSKTAEEIEKNTRRVVLHELGHYFGLDENRLEELGY